MTTKFVSDVESRLSELRSGVNAQSVRAFLLDFRPLIEATKSQKTYVHAHLLCTWAMHSEMDRHNAIPGILDDLNTIIFSTHSMIPINSAITDCLRLSEFRSQVIKLCTDCRLDVTLLNDDSLWKGLFHEILHILCGRPITTDVHGKEFKRLQGKHPQAPGLVYSAQILDKKASAVTQEGTDYYWSLSLVHSQNGRQLIISGAVVL
jgi:hypothetical protein